ncbi:MAG: hypothetical protein KDK41_08690 [Leptospiraceae bacterium]|nr:hypothetical protein [Leptospiraceae bacterium]
MRCERFIPGTQVLVQNTWEVRIPQEKWESVKSASVIAGKSFSWVIRWCVFTALQKGNKDDFARAVVECHNRRNSGASNSETHHRFQICLYGEDETWLKLSAIEMKCSVTSLVLAAVEIFLVQIIQDKVSSKDILTNGIKIMAKSQPTITYFENYPCSLACEMFFFPHIVMNRSFLNINTLAELKEITKHIG